MVWSVENTRWPGLARRQRNLHGFRIAHFANHDDVWRLTQRGTQRRRKVRRVDADFDLLDDALLVRVLVLNRILNRHDVPGIAPVYLVDERRDGCRLAGAGCPTYQYEAVMQPGYLLDL